MMAFVAAPRSLPRELAVAAALYLALALLLTWPAVGHLSSRLIGRGGDGFAFAWNLWWVKTALLDLHTSPLATTWLFHPLGTSLVFHTHTLANALAALPLVWLLGVVPAYNLMAIVQLALGATAGHLLALEAGAGRRAAFAAGLSFGFSPLVLSQLDYGWQNLASVSWLGFFVAFYHRALSRGGRLDAVIAGVFLALSAYNDYSLFIFAVLSALLLTVVRLWPFLPARVRVILPLAAGWAALALGFEWAGDLAIVHERWGGWLAGLLFIGFLIHAGVMILRRTRRPPEPPPAEADPPGVWSPLRSLPLCALAFCVTALPLLLAIGGWIQEHSGTSFRSDVLARRWGIRLPALLVPPELHPHLGSLHEQFWGDRTQPTQFVGLVAPLLAILAIWRRPRSLRGTFPWALLAGGFLALSLGPWLTPRGGLGELVHGLRPLRFRGPFYYLATGVPFLGALRAPDRFLAVVHLGLGVGAALGLSGLLDSWRRRSARIAGIGLAIVLCALAYERCPAPFPTVSAETPEAYRHLLEEPADGLAVLELPLGFRTGTVVDPRERTVYELYQCAHGRPLTTGFVARSERDLLQRMKQAPILRLLESLARDRFQETPQTPAPESLRAEAHSFVRQYRIGHVIVHRRAILVREPTEVIGDRAYERLLRWLPRMLPTRSCGSGPDWACFHLDAGPSEAAPAIP